PECLGDYGALFHRENGALGRFSNNGAAACISTHTNGGVERQTARIHRSERAAKFSQGKPSDGRTQPRKRHLEPLVAFPRRIGLEEKYTAEGDYAEDDKTDDYQEEKRVVQVFPEPIVHFAHGAYDELGESGREILEERLAENKKGSENHYFG